MNRDEKSAAIEEIAAQIEGAEAIFAVDYRGISVAQAAELRGKLRESDASFRVVKNRLTKLAADKAGEDRLPELLQGPTALTFVSGDTASAAKTISTFNKEHDILSFKGGFMGELLLDEDRFKSIARLPSREVLDGQLAGLVASPITGLVRGLGSMIQGLALQLGQIAEKGLVTGEAPAEEKAEEAPAEEPAAEEPAAEAEEAPAEEPAAEAEETPAEEPEEAPAEDDKTDEPEADAAGGEDADAGDEPAEEADASDDSETAETDKKEEE